MNPNIKRLLLIVLLLAVAVAIGFGIYTLFFKKVTTPVAVQPQPSVPGGQLPPAGPRPPVTGGAVGGVTPQPTLPIAGQIPVAESGIYQPTAVTQVTSDFVNYTSTNNTDGAARYYNAADGKFYKIQPDGSIKMLTSQIFYNVSNVTWATKQDKAILEYPDGSKIVYDFAKQKQLTTLPKHWQEFSFSPEGNQIAAKSIGLSPENRWLVTTNDDGTGTTLVEPMGNNADEVQINWSPSRQTVAFSMTGEAKGFDRREVLFVGLNHENFKSTVVEGMGFEPKWSPTGQKLLYSVYSARSNYNPELWVVNSYGDNIGSNRQALQINTWADKCAFPSDDILVCAVPRDLPQGAGMSPTVADNNIYDLYKIDLKTGLKINLPLGGDYRVQDVSYDQVNNKVFFTDKSQNGIFEVKL